MFEVEALAAKALETDEENNIDSILIEVTNPDLTIDNLIISPSVVSVGFSTRLEFDVLNLGEVNAQNSNLAYILSEDEILDEDDFFYQVQSLQAVDSLAEVAVAQDLTIPAYLDSGNYTVFIIVDPYDGVPETDEENNTASIGLRIEVPDLLISNPDVDKASLGISEELTIEARVQNSSSKAKSPSSNLGFYFSNDEVLDNEDTFLGFSSVESLELGSVSSVKTLTFDIPNDIKEGTYYIIFYADFDTRVNETNNDNNTDFIQVDITNPDLEPSSMVLSKTSLSLSEQFDISSLVISNVGDSPSPSGSVSFFLSTSENVNDSSINIGNPRYFNRINVNQDTVLESSFVAIPQFIEPSDYFVVAYVDYDTLIAEKIETNNQVSAAITILSPDLLTVNQELSSSEVTAGNQLTVFYNLKNDGQVSSLTSNTRFYLLLDSIEIEVGNAGEEAVTAFGTASQREILITLPATLDSGTYELIIEVDRYNNNIESDEDNNSFALTLKVLPNDFAVTSAYVSIDEVEPDSLGMTSTAAVGYVLEVSTTLSATQLQNQYDLNTIRTQAYVSADDLLDDGDKSLNTSSNWAILPSNDNVIYVRGTIRYPYNIPAGINYVLFKFDNNENFQESDEDNNIIAFDVNYGNAIKPDIIALAQDIIPSKFTENKNVRVTTTFTNDGRKNIFDVFETKFLLSDDELIDENDSTLSSNLWLEGLQIGDIRSVSQNLLTDSRSAGDYFLLGANDYTDTIKEESESNNSIASLVTYYAPLPIDFAPTFSSSLPDLVRLGDNLKISYEIENLGTGTRNEVLTTSIYFSEDNVQSAEDILLNRNMATAVSPNDISKNIETVRIPNDLTAGTYYLIIKTDSEELFIESDELNNTLAVEIEVGELITPDFTIDVNYVSPEIIAANTEFSLGLSYTNLGGGNFEDVSVGVYLNQINSLEGAQLIGYNEPPFSINAYSQGSIFLDGFEIPQDVVPGKYVILAVIDDPSAIEETDESNNVASVSIEVTPQEVADITILEQNSELITYEGELSNGFFQTSFFVANEGTKAETVSVGIYFSTDEIFDSQDLLISSVNEYFLNPFNQFYQTYQLQLPELLAGEYYILIQADPENEIFELDKENNLGITVLTVNPPSKPDLYLESGLSLNKSTIGINGLLEMTQQVFNLDRAATDSAFVEFYLSSDPTISTNDLLLGSTVTGYISAYGSSTVTESIFIPNTISQGSYYVIAIVDPDNEITESNESNNEAYVTLEVTQPVAPDLLVEINTAPVEVNANNVFDISYTISNVGDGAAAFPELGFYLSKDNLIDGSDIELSIESNPTIGNGQVYFNTSNLLIPGDTDPGSYQLILVVDPNNLVEEDLEDNNTSLASLEILEALSSDLIVSINSNVSFVNARQLIAVNLSSQNIGQGVASANILAMYLSEDDVLDGADQLIGSDSVGVLVAFESNVNLVTIEIPDVTPGPYYLIASIDNENQVQELDESNNTSVQITEVGGPVFADLSATFISLSNSAINAGNNLTTTITIQNNGAAVSQASEVDIFLSADEVLANDDTYLGTGTVNALNIGGQTNVTITERIPEGTTIGDYFIIADVDPDQLIEEELETNNTLAKAIEVLERLLPDLEINNASIQPALIPAGQDGNITASIFNTGDGLAEAFDVTAYLSSDATLDSGDPVLNTITVEAIDFGGSKLSQIAINVDRATIPGTYAVFVELDPANAVQETDEENNVFSLSFEVLEPLRSDLVVDQLTFNPEINAGGNLAVSFDVSNVGEITSSAGQVGVYFSTDDVLDASDEVISTLVTTPINSNNSDGFNVSVPIPLERDPGTYYIIVQADDGDQEEEIDELNNIATKSVSVTEPLPGNLTISQISADATSSPLGSSIQVEVTVSNTTSNAVLQSSVGLYISTDGILTGEDTKLGSQVTAVVAGQSSETLLFTVSPDEPLVEGDYFFIAMADELEEVTETDETDNVSSASITLTEAITLGADETVLRTITLYPNPVIEILTIDNQKMEGMVILEIFDLNGKRMLRKKTTNQSYEIDVTSFQAGQYILLISNGLEHMKIPFIKL